MSRRPISGTSWSLRSQLAYQEYSVELVSWITPELMQRRRHVADRGRRRAGRGERGVEAVERAGDLAQRPGEAAVAQEPVDQPRQRLDVDARRGEAGEPGAEPGEDGERQPPPAVEGGVAGRDRLEPRGQRVEIGAHQVGEEGGAEAQVGLQDGLGELELLADAGERQPIGQRLEVAEQPAEQGDDRARASPGVAASAAMPST